MPSGYATACLAAVRRVALPSLIYHLPLAALSAYLAVSVAPPAGPAVAAAYAPVVLRGLAEAVRARGRSPSLKKRAGLLESLYAL